MFSRRVRDAGVPHIRFHDLRHTHATLRLSHSTAAFTLEIYSHAVPSLQAEAAAAFGALVYGS